MAGITYLYLPVGTAEMLEFANEWNADLKTRNQPECPIISNSSSGGSKVMRRLFGNGLLNLIGTSDTLFVIAHGAANGSRQIGAERGATKQYNARGILEWDGGQMKSWTAEAFAKHLQKEGLRSDFVDLRLFACGSGLTPETAKIPFAEALFRALRKLAYARIEVTGYLGATRTSVLGTPVVEYAPRGGVTMVPIHEAYIRYT